MRKSFTRLFGLVMLFTLLSSVVMATFAGDATKVWPKDPSTGTTKAWTKTTDKIMVIYPGAVQASTGSIRVSTGGTLVRVLPATDSRVSYAKGDTVVIDLSADLKESTLYTVDIDPSTFKTVATTPVNKSAESWVFTTGDYTAPTLKSVVPESGAVISGTPTISLIMTFQDASSVLLGTGNVALYKVDGNVWDLVDVTTGTLTSTGSDYALTLTGIRTLEDNVNYAVTVGAGVVTDNGSRADGKKNSFAGLTDRTVWVFSTKDFSAPVISSGYPKAGVITNTSAAVLVKTNEPGTVYAAYTATSTTMSSADIVAHSTSKSVAVATAGTEYSINFTPLAESTTYYIHVVTKNVDGIYGTDNVVTVKTAESNAPVLADVTYYKGTTVKTDASVAGNVVTTAVSVKQDIDNIVLTFADENTGLKLGSGNVIIRKVEDNSVFATIPASSLTLGGTTTTATQTVKIPVSGFANNVKYYVTIPSTLVLDKFNNAYSGISSTVAWVFTTNDLVAPTFTYTPLEGASNVAKNANIVLTFSEVISATTTPTAYSLNASSGSTSPFEIKVGSSTVTFTVTSSSNGGKFTTVTINPDVDFASSAVVSVYIKPGSLADAGGNQVDTQGQGINFVVVDYVGPVIDWDHLPTTATTDAAVIKFNEPVYLTGGGEITNANLFSIITLKKNSDNSNIANTATIDATKKVITITPSSAWTSQESYLVGVSADLEDVAGNAFGGASRTNTITIGDVTPATVDLSSVDGKLIATTASVTLTFKQPSGAVDARAEYLYNGTWTATTAATDMQKVFILKEGSASGVDVPFTVTSSDNATFSIIASLVGNKTYYVGVGASTKGTDGNVNVAKFVTFSTKFEGAPEVTSFLPVDEATQVSKTSNLVVTFNTNVEKTGTATITLFDGTATTTIASSEITISNNVATINPTNDLSENKSYSVTIPTGVFKNANSAAVNADITGWNFTTTDTRVDLVSLSEDNSTSTTIDAKLKLGFSEKVVKGIGYIDIKKSATDALVERIDIVSSSVVLSDDQKTVTITPSANFSYNTAYYVEVSSGAIKDLLGNSLPAIDGKTVSSTLSEWTFTTSNPALAIVKVTPADGSDKVANDATIVVEFNREISAGTGAVGYVEFAYTASPTTTQDQFYSIGSTNITISGKTLTITHPNKLFPASNEIFVYLEAGAIKATTDPTLVNVATGKTSTVTYSFNTDDVNAPKPTFNPAQFDSNNPVYTAVDSNVTITFDEDVFNSDGSPINNGNLSSIFSLVEGTSTPVNFSGSIAGRVVTLTPSVALAEYTEYTISVNAGAIVDNLNHASTTTATSSFITVDKTAPVVTAPVLVSGNEKITVPAINVVDAALNNDKFYYLLRVKSTDAAPSVAEIKAANHVAISGSVVTGFDLTDLTASTTYQFYYVADDTFGNTSAVAVVEGKTFDTVAPLLVSTNPVAGAVDVNVAAGGTMTVTLTFNENVVPGTGTATVSVKDFATQSVYACTTSITSVSTDAKSVNLTISGFSPLAATKLYVEIPSGLIVDTASPTANSYAGAFGVNTINFTTEDNAKPTVDLTKSTKGTVDLDSNIEIVFSEDVKAGNGTLVLYEGTYTSTAAVQVFTSAEATFSGNKATVNPTANFKVGTAYYVSVNDGFAKDLSANANNNVAASGTVSFTGSSNVKPYVITVSPAGGATAIAKASLTNIQVGFNEDIYLTVAGLSKPLALLSQAELMAHVSLTDGNGAAVAISEIQKVGTSSITVVTSNDNLKDLTSYTLTIKGFEDIDALVMDDNLVTYKTSDGVAPAIVFNPANDATKVIPSTSLTLTFSEDIYADVVNANDKVFAYVDNSNVSTFVYLKTGGTATGTDTVDFTATISGKVISIVPTKALESGKTYYYGMLKTVEDINGQAVTLNVAGKTYATFTVADITAPTIVSWAPNTTGTSKTASMSVVFDENVVVSTGSVVIRREDGTIFQTVSGAGLSIDSADKKKLKIAHNDFEVLTSYFVEVGASVIVDESGNANALFNDPTPEKGWLFTTKDTYDLTATALTPMGDNTPRNVNVTMTFNKVPATRATDRYLAVYKADGTAVAQFAASEVVVSGNTATFPTIALDADQEYYARVEPNAFADVPGNKFAGIMDNSWTFSTVNNISPKVVTLAPADNTTSVDAQTSSLTVTFDRNIALGSGSIALRYADGSLAEEVLVKDAVVNGMTLTIKLTKALMAHKEYYVIVPAGAVTNTEITKDPFAGILNTYTWNFTTATDLSAPTAIYTPNGTTTPTTDNYPSLQMTFNEDVTVATGNVKIYKASDNVLTVTIPVTAAMLSGKTVSLTYAGGLDKNTNYYVLVDAGVVKDLAGNAFAGVTATNTWTFKTGADFATPVVPVISDSQFKVYPNPFVDYVTVSNASELSKVVVSNIAGQIVKEVVNPDGTIQLNELRSGVYFISLYQDGVVIKTVKIVKR